MELRINNSSKVTSMFGYWPKFCDAKILFFSFEENENGEKRITMRLVYIDSEQSIGAKIGIVFNGVSKTNFNDLFDQNELDELVIVKSETDSNYSVELQSCYGLSGEFNCESIGVAEVIKHVF